MTRGGALFFLRFFADVFYITGSFDLVHRDDWRADESIAHGDPLNSTRLHCFAVFQTRGSECQTFRRCVEILHDMQVSVVVRVVVR